MSTCGLFQKVIYCIYSQYVRKVTSFQRKTGWKRMKIISKEDFNNFVNSLISDDAWQVIGVKSKRDKFTFAPLESASELRLDYDVTLLPPTKYFFPQRETLFTYDLAGGFSAKGLTAEAKKTEFRVAE